MSTPPSGARAFPATASRAHRWAFKIPTSVQGWFDLLDMPMLGIWAYFSVIPHPLETPMRYLSMGYFLFGLILFYRQSLPTAARGWPAFIFAILAVVSMLWAPSSADAARQGMLMALTAVVAIHVATRLTGRQILLVYMLAELVGATQSIIKPTTDGLNWIGVYGQKNYLAVHMFILYVASLGLMLDKRTNGWIRLVCVPAALAAATLIILSHSATTVLMVILATATLFGHAFIWTPAARTRNARTLIVVILAVLGLAAALLLFGLLQLDAKNSLLEAFGKDSTLTGRTWLWDLAWRTIDQHPWFGLGAQGFFRPELGAAHEVTRYFYYESYIGFSFHNSYLENGVAYGYPGLYLTIFLAIWALWNTSMTWLKNQTTVNIVFLVFAIAVIVRSNAEIDLAQPLTGTLVILFIGAMRKDPPPAPMQASPSTASPLAESYGRRA